MEGVAKAADHRAGEEVALSLEQAIPPSPAAKPTGQFLDFVNFVRNANQSKRSQGAKRTVEPIDFSLSSESDSDALPTLVCAL